METGVKFPPKKSKSKIFCSVFGCNSKAYKNPELSFHRFPEAGQVKVNHLNKFGQSELIDRRVLWERALKMGKEVTQNMRVCSLYFTEDDYSIFTGPNYSAKARFLKKTSVPSINLLHSSVEIPDISQKTITERQIRLEVVQSLNYLNKDLTLKEKTNYFAQIQLGMAILNVQKTDFIIYTSFDNSFLILTVEFNHEFTDCMLKSLKNIYYNVMLHHICIKEGFAK